MGWYAMWVLYILGGTMAWDMYLDELERQEIVVETLPSKLAFAGTVAVWPLIELYNLIFRRGESTHGSE
jgi:hypothetical protein